MKAKVFITALLMLITGLYANINAQEEKSGDNLYDMSLEDLMNMEITSVSKKAEKLQNVPSSIYVITADNIERSSSQNMMQLLREFVPGLWAVANDYKNSDMFMRNTYEGSVLILLDGTPLLDLTSFNLDFESLDIPMHQIERIEVIKGSGGTVYGANSASGVISIVTKNPEDQDMIHASTDYAHPGKFDLNAVVTPVKTDRFSATVYGKFSTFSGFDQLDVTEDETSVVPVLHGTGTTEITNRFTGDDNTFNTINGGYNLVYNLSDNFKLSSGLNLVSIRNDSYYQEYRREDAYFILEDGMPTPRSMDNVYLSDNDKMRTTANLRADYKFGDTHSIFTRFSTNIEDRKYFLGGGFSGNNAIYDFEIQDNIEFGFNNLSIGGNYRLVKYDIEIRDGSSLAYINPEETYTLMGFFAQDKISLFDDKMNLYLGAKAETFSLINDKFYLSPMAKFAYVPNEKMTVWGGFTKSYTTPGYNQTNIELDIFRANSNALYPFYYPEVEQVVYNGVYQQAIAGGADDPTAAAMAQAYIESDEGLQVIDENINAQLEQDYPGGNINITGINGPKTEPTSFSTYEIGVRLNPSDKISFESNYFYSLVDNSVINSPTSVAVVESPTRPGQNIEAYYYGNYAKGHNTGIESVVKLRAMDNLMFELSHAWFSYNLELKENDDFDIQNDLTESQRDLVDEKYPVIPEHVFKIRASYDFWNNTRLTVSTIYSSAFHARFGTVNPTYQYEQQRYNPLWDEGGNQTLIGGQFDSRFILNLKLEKSFMDEKLNAFIYGYDIASSAFVEGASAVETVYPRQVAGLFGFGLSYTLNK